MNRFASVWLLVTAAVLGAVVMAVEILGARLLGAAYGGSLAVWAAMIAVTLLSLAVGYFVGGWAADRRPKPALLYGILLAASALVVLCPHTRFILKACHDALGIQGGALASSLIVFALPLGLMGVTGPFVIRLLCASGIETCPRPPAAPAPDPDCESGKGVGIRAGGVYAVSTLGSVAGTLLTGLWLIQTFGTAAGFRIAAVTGALVAAVGLVSALRLRGAAALVAPALLAFAPLPVSRVGQTYTAPDGEPVKIVEVRDSAHGRISVLDKGDYRLLVVNGIIQTGVPRRGQAKGRGLSEQYFQELLPYTVDDPAKTSGLIVGLAGGMTASMLRLYGMELDCVDLDPEIIRVARDYFGFAGPATAADGRTFLESCSRRYDFCVIDTYSGDVFPFHLATREAFAAAKGVLKPGGILAINYIGSPAGKGYACLDATVRAVFPHVRAIRGEPGDDVQTVTVFASDKPIAFNKGWLELSAGFSGVDPVSESIERLTLAAAPAGGFVLTDDYNPIDMLRAGEALRWRARTARNIGEAAIF
ncbi:MAG TPA: fused MFS/spermidine synthase [Planctomycetota bacterium]|nr:fused MFS/spermidine synthase [Planctomycetota bacterium]